MWIGLFTTRQRHRRLVAGVTECELERIRFSSSFRYQL